MDILKLLQENPKAFNVIEPPKIQHVIQNKDYLNAAVEDYLKDQEERQQEEADYKKSLLNSIQGIERNTALLMEMTHLLQKSNDKQDETFELMVEILEIMKSKDQDEANSKFMNVIEKIKTFTDNASTVQSLIGMASTVYTALSF
ncbi:hypothetical protein ACIQXQ_20685 [Peribacillus sp. NPDC097198]|uniref:hypothetical protein n=1 Tax=Peribacillus sp. NPDC097198 TaxID=3364397 RepID=UPI0038170A0E